MAKTFLVVIPTVLFFLCGLGAALECYHCFIGKTAVTKDSNFIECNKANISASNVWKCPHPNAKCVYETVDVQYKNQIEIWRTCSNGILDPCDPNALPVSVKMIECSYCSTDRCNLNNTKENNSTFTFNINANVNVFVRQLN